MSTAKDGGQVAPCMETDGTTMRPYDGMTLRDWFAGMALQGLLSLQTVYENRPDKDVATHAYSAADAMISARNEKEASNG